MGRHARLHLTFNKAHATSFAILGKKSAVALSEAMRESFIAILERYPDNPRYVAAAIREGYRFERPDVNLGSAGFTKGSDERSIRVGLLRIDGVGPGAANEIVRNQPFSSVDDIKERTNSQRVKAPTITALAATGALEGLGISAEDDDMTQFRYLNMVLRRPRAFDGCKPSVKKRANSRWEFLGLERGLNLTFGKRFCAKLFLIPDEPKVETKTSGSGHYNAHLMTVIDENGIPFDLQVGEHKDAETKLLRQLAKMPGAVVCAEGQVSLPFLRGANTSFKLWSISRAEEGNPQMWHCDQEDADKVIAIHRRKESLRRG